MNKVAIHTIGCKLNYAESSAIFNLFAKNGFEHEDFNNKADIYIVNTCTVTNTADKECRQIVRRALRNNPEGFVIVTGCYAQLRPDEIKTIKGVDLILGTNEKFHILDFVKSFKKKQIPDIFISEKDKIHNIYGAFTDFSNDRTRAFLKIQDGCDYKCTYCTIPMARGESRSIAVENVLEQFRLLIELGYKEIVLTGVNTGDFGRKINTNLFNLLEKLVSVEGDFRIRISSIEPNLLTDEIISLTKENNKLCRHFHIPLQSGSDKILKQMKRCYSTKLYHDLVYKIKDQIPDCGIGVDVIAGFPEETDKDFYITKEFITKLPVSYLHAFTFSERPGTKASEVSNQITKEVRKKRTNELRRLSDLKREEFFRSQLDSVQRILFEGYDETGIIKGFSSNYIRVSHNNNSIKENSFVNYKILNYDKEICSGEIIK